MRLFQKRLQKFFQTEEDLWKKAATSHKESGSHSPSLPNDSVVTEFIHFLEFLKETADKADWKSDADDAKMQMNVELIVTQISALYRLDLFLEIRMPTHMQCLGDGYKRLPELTRTVKERAYEVLKEEPWNHRKDAFNDFVLKAKLVWLWAAVVVSKAEYRPGRSGDYNVLIHEFRRMDSYNAQPLTGELIKVFRTSMVKGFTEALFHPVDEIYDADMGELKKVVDDVLKFLKA